MGRQFPRTIYGWRGRPCRDPVQFESGLHRLVNVDVNLDYSPYTTPAGNSYKGSFTVDVTTADGVTTRLTQGIANPRFGIPDDLSSTRFDFNNVEFGAPVAGLYDGGAIDTIWTYEERGRWDPESEIVPGRPDPAAVWDNFIVPEPATGLLLTVAAFALAARRRRGT